MLDVATIKALVGGGSASLIPIVMMYALFTPLDTHQRFVAESSRVRLSVR